jgi:HEAT repeat protein
LDPARPLPQRLAAADQLARLGGARAAQALVQALASSTPPPSEALRRALVRALSTPRVDLETVRSEVERLLTPASGPLSSARVAGDLLWAMTLHQSLGDLADRAAATAVRGWASIRGGNVELRVRVLRLAAAAVGKTSAPQRRSALAALLLPMARQALAATADELVRTEGVSLALTFESPEGVALLRSAAHDPAPRVRGQAAWALGQQLDAAALHHLEERLRLEPWASVQREAIEGLASRCDPPLRRELMLQLVRQSSGGAPNGGRPPPSRRPLDGASRELALSALTECGERRVEPLLGAALMDGGRPMVERARAAELLGVLVQRVEYAEVSERSSSDAGPPAGAPQEPWAGQRGRIRSLLVDLLGRLVASAAGTEAALLEAVARSVGRARATTGVEPLLALLRRAPPAAVQRAAAEALTTLCDPGLARPPFDRAKAMSTLGTLARRAATEELREALARAEERCAEEEPAR